MRTSFHTGLPAGTPVLEAIAQMPAAGFAAAEVDAGVLPWGDPHVIHVVPRDAQDDTLVAAIKDARGERTDFAVNQLGTGDIDQVVREESTQ